MCDGLIVSCPHRRRTRQQADRDAYNVVATCRVLRPLTMYVRRTARSLDMRRRSTIYHRLIRAATKRSRLFFTISPFRQMHSHGCVNKADVASPTERFDVDLLLTRSELECGPMPNVMVALPIIGGALCSTPQSLADAHY